MNSNSGLAGNRLRMLAAAVLTLASAQIPAAPGPLSETPLFLAKGVQPNIFFLLDDSGSMDWEVLLRNDGGEGSQYLDFFPDNETRILQFCVGFNAMAYDPTETYTPWKGLDTDGKPFADQDPKKARVNPYTGEGAAGSCLLVDTDFVNNANGVTCDLEGGFGGKGAYYYAWDDKDNDHLYDKGECPIDLTSRKYVKDMETQAEKVNFANWFSYYRKREYVMKRALSQIIVESRDRLGLGVINNVLTTGGKNHATWDKTNAHVIDHDAVGAQVKDMDDLTLPVDSQAAANKTELLDNLLGVNSDGGTPLRVNLKYVGDYFKGTLKGTNPFGFVPVADADSASAHSPILKKELGGTCQQNFVVLFSDGFWNGSAPDIGNEDGNGNSSFDGQSYADNASNTLADVAMSLYEGDLLDGLDDAVPAVAIPRGSDTSVSCYDSEGKRNQECFDTNKAQHLVTFVVSFGLTGDIPLNADGTPCIPLNRTDPLSTQKWPSSCPKAVSGTSDGWPTPVEKTPTTADDMQHAAWNGRGLYLAAKEPAELISRLRQAIGNISARKPAAAAAVAVNTFNVVSGGNIYQGRFDAGIWAGELYAWKITGMVLGDDAWAAHTLLAERDINERILVTYDGSKGIPFAFPADYTNPGEAELSQAQIDDLLYNAPFAIATEDATEKGKNQDYGESLMAYLRGATANEGSGASNFRERHGQRLGDIIHSAPVYVGNPDPTLYPDTIATGTGSSYQAWANNQANHATDPGAYGRQAMVYVGANDGALHAFNATDGKEVFAYYPLAVFSAEERLGLHWLASPVYEHRYYVDIEPAVGEVYVDTGDTDGLTWRTVLVGGLRGGGRGIYAIDVSDPGEFTDAAGVAGNVLWEFTHPDLGYTYSKPTIAKLNDGRWAAIFGNGYNPGGAGATGEAVLFIKYLDKASPPYRAISTQVGSIDTTSRDCLNAGSKCNGLSTPSVVDLGADRVADRVYAGDLNGNLWVFDLSSSTPSEWKSAYDTAGVPDPLFSAYYLDAESNKQPQPITAQPIVTLHPTQRRDATSPNTMVFFGTGQYIVENDPITKGTNSFYGIWDSGAPIKFDRNSSDPALVDQELTVTKSAGKDVRMVSNKPVNYETHKGWFVDLPEKGERITSSPLVYEDVVLYSSIVPASNLCSDVAGYNWFMAQKLADGAESDFIVLDVTGEGDFDGADQVGSHNVAGIKSSGLASQPVTIDTGHPTVLLPGAGSGNEKGLDGTLIKLGENITKATRSSWGIFRFGD